MNTRFFDWHRFFFRPIRAEGFGMMRIAWALVILSFFLHQLPSLDLLYGSNGVIGYAYPDIFRNDWRFSLFDTFNSPAAVRALSSVFILSLLSTIIGFYTRLSVLLSLILLFSFHERNTVILGGGDTVLRLIGFLLLLAPGTTALSLDRLRAQWKEWKRHNALLPPLMQPVWPMRLVLWQLIVIYAMTGLEKLTGEMWRYGSAVITALHHPHFQRLPDVVLDILALFGPLLSWAVIAFELSWMLLLIPRSTLSRLTRRKNTGSILKRTLLLFGLLFHFAIFALMRVGSFPQAMIAFYLGTLDNDDLASARKTLNRNQTGKFTMLYDGHCGLCKRTVFWLTLLDWLHRLQFVDYQDAAARKAIAPHLEFADLDKALHLMTPDGTVYKGFFAFRFLSWHLPALWLFAPFLYLPGVAALGQRAYGRVAARRKACTHENCAL